MTQVRILPTLLLGTFTVGLTWSYGNLFSGSQYDSECKLFDWWSAESRRKYNERAKGLVEKFGNYSLKEGRVSGLLTLGENIADAGGAKEAFLVFHAPKTTELSFRDLFVSRRTISIVSVLVSKNHSCLVLEASPWNSCSFWDWPR